MQNDSLVFINQGCDNRSIWADVAICGTQLTVSPEAAECLLERYPTLASHVCKTKLFGDHLPGALLPHALEHLTIDLLVAARPGEIFAGNTHWLERKEQTMRVHISLPKEGGFTLVNEALSEALLQLNEILAENSRQID